MSSLKAKQPKKPPSKRTRNVGKFKRVELTTSSSTESPPSDNGDLPSTKLSPRSYSRAFKDDPNMSKEQRETRRMFKNLGRALSTCLLESACLNWMLKLSTNFILCFMDILSWKVLSTDPSYGRSICCLGGSVAHQARR
ncbi:hypothetical protein Tco_0171509 [Tanacetum coccineum]